MKTTLNDEQLKEVTDNTEVRMLLVERDRIEGKIRKLDESALIKYELVSLGLPSDNP